MLLQTSVESARESMSEVVAELGLCHAQMWRIEDSPAKGIFVTQINHKTLFIWHVAGRNLWKVRKSLWRELKALVKYYGLEGIQSFSTPDIAEMLRLYGFSTHRTVVEWRADNGR